MDASIRKVARGQLAWAGFIQKAGRRRTSDEAQTVFAAERCNQSITSEAIHEQACQPTKAANQGLNWLGKAHSS